MFVISSTASWFQCTIVIHAYLSLPPLFPNLLISYANAASSTMSLLFSKFLDHLGKGEHCLRSVSCLKVLSGKSEYAVFERDRHEDHEFEAYLGNL